MKLLLTLLLFVNHVWAIQSYTMQEVQHFFENKVDCEVSLSEKELANLYLLTNSTNEYVIESILQPGRQLNNHGKQTENPKGAARFSKTSESNGNFKHKFQLRDSTKELALNNNDFTCLEIKKLKLLGRDEQEVLIRSGHGNYLVARSDISANLSAIFLNKDDVKSLGVNPTYKLKSTSRTEFINNAPWTPEKIALLKQFVSKYYSYYLKNIDSGHYFTNYKGRSSKQSCRWERSIYSPDYIRWVCRYDKANTDYIKNANSSYDFVNIIPLSTMLHNDSIDAQSRKADVKIVIGDETIEMNHAEQTYFMPNIKDKIEKVSIYHFTRSGRECPGGRCYGACKATVNQSIVQMFSAIAATSNDISITMSANCSERDTCFQCDGRDTSIKFSLLN